MRKLIGLTVTLVALAGGGIAFGGQAATSSSGYFLDLSVVVTPPVAGTAKAPQGVGVSFDDFDGNRINGDTPSDNNSIQVRFNKGFKENGARFPSCAIAPPPALSKCSKSAQIGTGTAEADITGKNGGPPAFIPATLVAYNGKPYSGKAPTIIFSALVNGKPATELDFTVKQQPVGPYGLVFTEIQFPASTSNTVLSGITKFAISIPDRSVTHKVHGKTVKVHLIDGPTTCNGLWEFAQTNRFSNAPPVTATDAQPCTNS
jgi:hypothetical protein